MLLRLLPTVLIAVTVVTLEVHVSIQYAMVLLPIPLEFVEMVHVQHQMFALVLAVTMVLGVMHGIVLV
jgi:hypothetical protein